MAGISVYLATTDAEAKRLFTSAQQQFTNMVRNRRGKLQPPIDDIETYWTPQEKAHVNHMLRYAFAGSSDTVRQGLEQFVAMTAVDELMVVSHIYDHEARLRSYELLGEIGLAR
jgi:alkanesulfonate monooxygenase SsuD/methylene tetrahydromethanopterin reductase-like flavin-dependent oxidoreductase (luciferase family)